jgi:hypothetical protein
MAAKTYKRSAKASPSKAKQLAKELQDQLANEITKLVTSDAWPQLLKAMAEKNGTELSRFSFQNMLMVLMQCPEASAVASFKAWGERGRGIIKGSKSIRVYAPITAKDRENEDKTKVVGFRAIPEFDVSQTEPRWQDPTHNSLFITPTLSRLSIAKRLEGDAPEEMWDDVAAQITALGYTVERGATGSANGYTDPKSKTVRVSDAVSEAQAAKTLAHELGHILAGHTDDYAEYAQHRGAAETVAESFAWMVCQYYGLESVAYSAPYIGVWAGKDPEKVLKTVQEVGTQTLKMFRAYVMDVEIPSTEGAGLVAA